MKLYDLSKGELKGKLVLYTIGWLEQGRMRTQRKLVKITRANKKYVRIENARGQFDMNGIEKKDISNNSTLGFIQLLSDIEMKQYLKLRDKRLAIGLQQVKAVAKLDELASKNNIKVKTEIKPKHAMNIIEAGVEAALFSKLTDRTVYIVHYFKDKDEFYLSTSEDDKKNAETFYKNGCKEGKGYTPPATREDTKPKKKLTQEEAMERAEQRKLGKVSNPKQPTVLEVKEFASVTEAAKSTESCKAKIKGKIWVVSVKGSWAIQRSIIDQCEAGLILVIRDQGFYNYPKNMWNEFESIFKSSTYDAGKPYSQSILPKKFEKYFTKFTKK